MRKLLRRTIRTAVVFLAFAVIALPANAQGIYVLISSGNEQYMQAYRGFADAVKDKENVRINHSVMEDENSKLLEEVTYAAPNIIVAIGSRALDFSLKNLSNKKIIYCMVISGVSSAGIDIAGKVLSIPDKYKVQKIKELLPHIRTAGTVYTDMSQGQVLGFENACRENGINFMSVRVADENEFPKALNRIKDRIDIYMMFADSRLYYPDSIRYLFMESMGSYFPVIGLSSYYTKAGALLSFDYDYYSVGRETAELIYKKETGGIEDTTAPEAGFMYSINLKVAEELGIKFSESAVKGAYEVYGR